MISGDESLRAIIEKRLKDGEIESAAFEAKELALFCRDMSAKETEKIIKRRLSHEPLQYILGEWEFYGLPFFVGPGVLIPRPDTETLVDLAIKQIGDGEKKVIDICSGSGCIAVSVAKNCKRASVSALEKSKKAIKYLQKNAEKNEVNLFVINADLCKYKGGKYDVVLSNPPYITPADMKTLQFEVRHEPKMALKGGKDGLFFYRSLAKKWIPRLNHGGMMAVEVGYNQASDVAKIFREHGLSQVKTALDLNGIERVVYGTLD